MEEQNKKIDEEQRYASTLDEVIQMFESCGCSADVTIPAPSQAVLGIKGPVSLCPISIFEEHIEKAKELMQASHPDVAFRIEITEVE